MTHKAISHFLSQITKKKKTHFHQLRPSLQAGPASITAPAQEELDSAKKILRRILFENILPFWYPHVIDYEHGGYRLNHDFQGGWKGQAGKFLVSQARTLWFFSRLARSKYGEDKYREAAKHGYCFLSEKLWDKKYGGFYWETDPAGEKAHKAHKLLFGQAFGIYALSEYGDACGDDSAIALAEDLFSILQKHAYDAESGGYREFFLETWAPAPPDMFDYRGMTAAVKSMNTHLHLMEAISNYLRVTGNPDARARLVELIFILSNAVVLKTVGACTDAHMHDWSPFFVQGDFHVPNWSPLNHRELSRVSYGHDIENVWLLIESCNALGISNAPCSICIALYLITLFVTTLITKAEDFTGADLSMPGPTEGKSYGGSRQNVYLAHYFSIDCLLKQLIGIVSAKHSIGSIITRWTGFMAIGMRRLTKEALLQETRPGSGNVRIITAGQHCTASRSWSRLLVTITAGLVIDGQTNVTQTSA